MLKVQLSNQWESKPEPSFRRSLLGRNKRKKLTRKLSDYTHINLISTTSGQNENMA